MLNFENTKIGSIVVHKVGNKAREEGVSLSDKEIKLTEDLHKEMLMMYFTKPFTGEITYNFTHASDIKLNEVYAYAHNIFNNIDNVPGVLLDQSKNIANHLYKVSAHPRVKSGELYVVFLRDVLVDDELCDAIGIFKSEKKDNYINVGKDLSLGFSQGININKLDKGCIIFYTESEKGFKVLSTAGKTDNADASFWNDDFLRLEARSEDYYATKKLLDMVEKFTIDVMNKDNNFHKKEQIGLRSNAAYYFTENTDFVMQDFEEKVLQEPEIIETFREYGEAYKETYHISDLPTEFSMDAKAKKDVVKKFKSVIKLDSNFHIYVHAKPELMEKGYDEAKKRSFYKVYFNEEN